jgi:hypothetical protein
MHKTTTTDFWLNEPYQMGEGVSWHSNQDRSRKNGRRAGDPWCSGGWAAAFSGAMVEAHRRR